jgi:hypothetical protein
MKIGEIVRTGDREPAPAWQPKRTDAPPSKPAAARTGKATQRGAIVS